MKWHVKVFVGTNEAGEPVAWNFTLDAKDAATTEQSALSITALGRRLFTGRETAKAYPI